MAILGVISWFKGTCDATLAFAWGLLSCLQQGWLKCLCSWAKKVPEELPFLMPGSVLCPWLLTSCHLSQHGAAPWHIRIQQHPISSILLFFLISPVSLVEMDFPFCSWQPTAQTNPFLSCSPTVMTICAQNFSRYHWGHSDGSSQKGNWEEQLLASGFISDSPTPRAKTHIGKLERRNQLSESICCSPAPWVAALSWLAWVF